MFGIFQRQAPSYQGTGQPQPEGCGTGLLGLLGRVLSGAKPAYRGAGQPTATDAGWCSWFATSPGYRTATPAPETATPTPTIETAPEPAPEPTLDPGPNGEGDPIVIEHGEPLMARVPVTIVIRRSLD